MPAMILISTMAALTGAAYGMIAHGAGFWSVLGWYVIGGWAGFALTVAALLFANALRRPNQPDMHAPV